MGDVTEDPERFAAALDKLKQAGCLVLVTGTVDVNIHAACSRRLFGSRSCPRQRVIIHPDPPTLSLDTYLPNGLTVSSPSVWSIANTKLRGDTTTSSTCFCSDGGPFTPDPPSEHDAYDQAFDELLAEIEPTGDTFAPGELRVGILTGTELLDQYGLSAVQRIFMAIKRGMRARQGMAHCHLSAPSESDLVTDLAASADIHVRLREREGGPPEQYWSLHAADCGSGWLPIDTEE